MDWLQLLLLALIQGITEFLPISSSAHLLLPQALLGWPDQGLAFDVAVHVGSLAAVVVYFRRDIQALAGGWTRSLTRRENSAESRLAWYLIWATVPAGLTGLLLHDVVENHLRSTLVIALATLGFGIALGWADRRGRRELSLGQLTLTAAVLIGCAQALALIPGTSRSGITITAALLLGFQRQEAARFSFLLAIPVIALSGAYKAFGLADAGAEVWGELLTGALLAGISAYLCIHFFLAFINRIGMMPFVVYRLLLGGGLLIMLVVQEGL